MLCIVSLFFLVWDLLRKKRLKLLTYDKRRTIADVLILLMTFYLIKGADTNAYSATSIGSLLIGICAMFALSKLRAHPEYIAYFVAAAVIGVAATLISAKIILGWSPIGWAATVMGRDETLTGRVDIWNEVFKIAPRWSVLGTGFGGFWGLPYTSIPIGQNSGHNGYLDVYVELGFVGIFLLSLFLLNLWGKLSIEVKHNFDWGLLGICILLMSMTYNYTESDFLSVSSVLWTVLLFMTFVLSGEAKAKAAIPADSLRCQEFVWAGEIATGECGRAKKGLK